MSITIKTTVKGGLPCTARMTHYLKVGPDISADNDWDYRGYTEIEFELLTRAGKPSPWMDKQMTDADRERIEQELLEARQQEMEPS
jgi:hypothetical protein